MLVTSQVPCTVRSFDVPSVCQCAPDQIALSWTAVLGTVRWLARGIISESIMVKGVSVGDVSSSCKCHRYPVEVSSPCVWLYFRFPLLFREVEEVMLERGVIAFHETVRRLCVKFGQAYTDGPLPSQASIRGRMGLGQGLRQDQRQAALPVVCGRPGRQRARHPVPFKP